MHSFYGKLQCKLRRLVNRQQTRWGENNDQIACLCFLICGPQYKYRQIRDGQGSQIVIKIKRMRILLLIFILNLTGIKAQTCQQNCSPLSYYDCSVCFNNCGGTYTFKNCLQKYCAQYYYYYSNGKRRSRCIFYSFYSFSEQGCIASCCGDVGIGQSTMDQKFLGTCIQENTRLTNLLGIILGSVFGGIALIFISIGVFVWRRRHA